MVKVPSQFLGGRTNGGQEVGSTDVADEESVAGEHAVWLAVRSVGTDHDAYRFGRVTGGFEYLQIDRTQTDAITVSVRLDRESHATGRRRSVDDCCSGVRGQFGGILCITHAYTTKV